MLKQNDDFLVDYKSLALDAALSSNVIETILKKQFRLSNGLILSFFEKPKGQYSLEIQDKDRFLIIQPFGHERIGKDSLCGAAYDRDFNDVRAYLYFGDKCHRVALAPCEAVEVVSFMEQEIGVVFRKNSMDITKKDIFKSRLRCLSLKFRERLTEIITPVSYSLTGFCVLFLLLHFLVQSTSPSEQTLQRISPIEKQINEKPIKTIYTDNKSDSDLQKELQEILTK